MTTINIQHIPDNYQPPSGTDQFETLADGTYNVKGMEWKSKDDAGNPILVKSEKMLDMFGRLQFKLENGDKGPAMTLPLYEMPLLALAFDPDCTLPETPNETEAGKVSNYMKKIESIVNNAKIVKSVEVKGGQGWVSYVEGGRIPANKSYYFRIVRVNSRNERGEPSKIRLPNFHKDTTLIQCEILAENQSKETKYKNVQFELNIPYGFMYENDTLNWDLTEVEKKWSTDAKRAHKLYNLTAPTMFDPFDPDDVTNLIPYWIRHADFENTILLGQLTDTQSKKGNWYYGMELNMLELVENFKVEPNSYSQPEPATDEELDVKARNVFKEVMDHLSGGESMTTDWEPTELGRKTAKQYLTPLKEKGKIKGKEFKSLTFEDVSSYLSALIDSLEPDTEERKKLLVLQEKLELSLVGLEGNIMEIDEDDIPF